MELIEARVIPLYESGNAPRILVTDIDRLEKVADGIYCFVCTRSTQTGGIAEDQVVLYIDATPRAVAKGISLSFKMITELPACLRLLFRKFSYH